MSYQDKLEELYEYIKEFKQEFAQIECLNPNYIGIIISDNNDIVVYPTDENGQNQCYKY